ncbi:hypothetical protein BGX28_003915 [Mortierella sp. GBA30]|nr:hypothetical protein BGX28_003915 [Mortierella sp. GBA30]
MGTPYQARHANGSREIANHAYDPPDAHSSKYTVTMAPFLKTADLLLDYKTIPAEQIPQVHAIEVAEYPKGEPAPLEVLIYRQNAVPELFFGCFPRPANNTSEEQTSTIAGYIVSTLASGDRLTHDSMYKHDPSGNAVCIHSVCVSKDYQRRGIASAMLREYLKHIRMLKRNTSSFRQVDRLLLIAHDYLIDMYARAGFELVGRSDVEWGPDPWFEMEYRL